MANIASTGSGNQSITYYAPPNKTIDGISLPSNIQDIVGGGGDIINLANGQHYFPNVGNDTVNGVGSNGWNSIDLWDGTTGNITIDFTKGVMSPNGFGGVDTFTNINSINDSGGINLIMEPGVMTPSTVQPCQVPLSLLMLVQAMTRSTSPIPRHFWPMWVIRQF